jgi:XTP/dITP diphosphohydrolase
MAEYDLILATHNRGKLEELRQLLGESVRIGTSADLGLEPPEETGTTFEANARLKAVATSLRTDALALADDSGLEVDALDGAPGVRSARFAGPGATDVDNIRLLLERLAQATEQPRTARFVSVVALARNGVVLALSEGECSGSIGYEPRGSNGFGYDPVFVLPDGRTMAELSADEKNRISHRGRALRSLLPELSAALAQR